MNILQNVSWLPRFFKVPNFLKKIDVPQFPECSLCSLWVSAVATAPWHKSNAVGKICVDVSFGNLLSLEQKMWLNIARSKALLSADMEIKNNAGEYAPVGQLQEPTNMVAGKDGDRKILSGKTKMRHGHQNILKGKWSERIQLVLQICCLSIGLLAYFEECLFHAESGFWRCPGVSKDK